MLTDSVESSWESALDDPMVRDLAARMADRSGKSLEDLMTKLAFMARVVSAPGLLAVAREPLEESELLYSAVLQRVRLYADEHTPQWTLCSGGATSLEISPNGFYGRCPKTGAAQEYMGDVRDEGPLKVFDPALDDLTCTIPCKKMMCFRNNVIRAVDDEDFAVRMEKDGLRGNYNPAQAGYNSNIFIRWKITDVCNYTCAYCCDWRTVNAKGMETTDAETMAAAERIVGQFDSISMRLTGGEPSSRRCYVDLMRLFHDNLDRFTDIEIRTNLSFQTKHKEVLNWDWGGKLHLHIGCHIRDKSFMPWRMVEVLNAAPNANYVLKFVSMPAIRPHVDFFKQYFLDNGIPNKNIKVVDENSNRKDTYRVELEEAPLARKKLEEQARTGASADLQPDSAAPVNGACQSTGGGCGSKADETFLTPEISANSASKAGGTLPIKGTGPNSASKASGTRLTITDLRAVTKRTAERNAEWLATLS